MPWETSGPGGWIGMDAPMEEASLKWWRAASAPLLKEVFSTTSLQKYG